jgi:hypothetical protein
MEWIIFIQYQSVSGWYVREIYTPGKKNDEWSNGVIRILDSGLRILDCLSAKIFTESKIKGPFQSSIGLLHYSLA